MIWFFIAGFISGVVGTVMYSKWWMYKHLTILKIEDIKEDKNKND